MTIEPAYFPDEFLQDQEAGGPLSTLQPLAWEDAKVVADQHKGISLQYINFITKIGVGETRNGLYIYEPYCASELTNHPSYEIYNSPSSRRLFGLLPAKPTIPSTLVCVADSGASWRYCLDLNKGDEIYCLDMFGAEVTRESDDFFSFIECHVLSTEEH